MTESKTEMDSYLPSYDELVCENKALKEKVVYLESLLAQQSAQTNIALRQPDVTPLAQYPVLDSKVSEVVNKYTPGNSLTNPEIFRYARHLLLPEIGVAKQIKWGKSRVLVVGAGGLGAPVCLYLAAAGIGHITIVDDDHVDLTNLQRQVIHNENTVGLPKAHSARDAMLAINSTISVDAIVGRFTEENAISLVESHDIVVDATDNVVTRYLLNDATILCSRRLVSGSALRLEGQLTIYGGSGPCYRCLYPSPPPAETVTNCSDGGVLGMIPGIIGCLQSLETLKVLAGESDANCMVQRLLLFDGASFTFRNVKLRAKNPNCAVCGENPTVKKDALQSYTIFCNSRADDRPVEAPTPEATSTPQLENWAVPVFSHVKCTEYAQKFANILTINTTKHIQSTYTKKFHFLVDVRDPVQFEICSLPFSANVPFRYMESVQRKNNNHVRRHTKLLLPALERQFTKLAQTHKACDSIPIKYTEAEDNFKLIYQHVMNIYTFCEIFSCIFNTPLTNTLSHSGNPLVDNCQSEKFKSVSTLSVEELASRIRALLGDDNEVIPVIFYCRRGIFSCGAAKLVQEMCLTFKKSIDAIHDILCNKMHYLPHESVWETLGEIWTHTSTPITEFAPIYRVVRNEETKTTNMVISTDELTTLVPKIELTNLVGGLVAMHYEVDTNIPMY